MARAKCGLLLLDEVENGIHHTKQPQFWELLLSLSEAYNVQVFATTHSWDCVVGFSQAIENQDDPKGGAFRIDRWQDSTLAIPYTPDDLHTAKEQGIDVR